jgi:hypothetical protein
MWVNVKSNFFTGNWMPQYNLNIVESDIKHHNPNPYSKHDVYAPCANINKE